MATLKLNSYELFSQSSNNKPIASTGMPSGMIVKIASVTKTDANWSYSQIGLSPVIDGLTPSITPLLGNKIYITGNINYGRSNYNTGYPLKLFRTIGTTTTEIGSGDITGSLYQEGIACLGNITGTDRVNNVNISFMDSPNTDQQITYSLKVYSRETQTTRINTSGNNVDEVYTTHTSSTLTLTEIAA